MAKNTANQQPAEVVDQYLSKMTQAAYNIRFPRKKIIRVEPSPFASTTIKLKQSLAKVNSAGLAMQNRDNSIQKVDADVKMVQIPGTTRTLKPSLTPSGLKTGLDILVDNPYKDEEIYHPSWGEKVLKGKDKIPLQYILEYKHGREYNYYTNQLFDRVSKSEDLATLPFFLTAQSGIELGGNVTFFDLSNPIDEVKYYVLRCKGIVANSYEDLQEGRNPLARYYIVDESKLEDRKIVELRKTTQAGKMLEELLQSGDVINKMARCLGNDDKSLTPEKSFKWIHDYYTASEINYNTFMRYYELYKDAARRDQFFAAAELQEFKMYGVIRERENKFYWTKPETDDSPARHFEWESKEKVIKNFILAPEYTEEYAICKSIYESRK